MQRCAHTKSVELQIAVPGKQTLRWSLPCRMFIKECPRNWNLWKRGKGKKWECTEGKRKLQCKPNFKWSSGARAAFENCPRLGLAGQDFILLHQRVTGYGRAQEGVWHQARQLCATPNGSDSYRLSADSTSSSWCSKSSLEMGSEQCNSGSTTGGKQITQIQEVKVSQNLSRGTWMSGEG